jgi:phenylacetate-CoA ligase
MPVGTRAELARLQDERLAALLTAILPHNRFYARKLAAAGLTSADLRADFTRLPFTTKEELLADQEAEPPFGSVLTYPIEFYSRYHQTSGTLGRPLRWLDTPESWVAMLDCWTTIFRLVGLRPGDRLFFPFSFGPFLGFWTAFEAAARLGFLCLPGGGMSSGARLRFLLETGATVVFCTPTYALHLAEVARAEGIDLPASTVRAVIVAGEPGGSIPATRARIEAGWGARVFDHTGMTEVGPVGVECAAHPGGLHLVETHYRAEVVAPDTGQLVPPGTVGELVLTTLARTGSPLLRYRTGDLVCLDERPCPCGEIFLRLDGGIRGRVDNMIFIRGNNVFPTALQTILHRFPEVAEYRLEVATNGSLTTLRIEVEPQPSAEGDRLAARVDRAIRDELLFRAEVRAVQPGTLPRFEMKAQRLVRRNGKDEG